MPAALRAFCTAFNFGFANSVHGCKNGMCHRARRPLKRAYKSNTTNTATITRDVEEGIEQKHALHFAAIAPGGSMNGVRFVVATNEALAIPAQFVSRIWSLRRRGTR